LRRGFLSMEEAASPWRRSLPSIEEVEEASPPWRRRNFLSMEEATSPWRRTREEEECPLHGGSHPSMEEPPLHG